MAVPQKRAAAIALVALVCAGICVRPSAASGSAPLVGGAGKALIFDHLRADVVGDTWDPATQPTENMTVEFWVNLYDPYIDQQTVLTYSTFDSSQTPMYSALIP
eukprot:Opistho-1_new@75189